jgi:Fe2+ or Zn2+ uptake regulation protein
VNVHDIATTRLRGVKQRYTSGRKSLVTVLADAGAPLTIMGILAKEPSLALSSTYRNLVVLEQAGVVQRIVTSDEYARYELAEDLTEHHHHLICSDCGSVLDFTIADQLERALDQALRRVAKRNDYVLDHHRLDLVGVCPDCR